MICLSKSARDEVAGRFQRTLRGSNIKGYKTLVAVGAANVNAANVPDNDLVGPVAVSADGQAAFFLVKHGLAKQLTTHKGVGEAPCGASGFLEQASKRQMMGDGHNCLGPVCDPAELLSKAISQKPGNLGVQEGPFDPLAIHPTGSNRGGLGADV